MKIIFDVKDFVEFLDIISPGDGDYGLYELGTPENIEHFKDNCSAEAPELGEVCFYHHATKTSYIIGQFMEDENIKWNKK